MNTTNTNNITAAAAALGRKGGKSTSDSKVTAARANGRKGGRPPFLELVCPDVAAAEWDEFFRINGKKVAPSVLEINQFGARVVLNGWLYTADQDMMEGYPNAGSYYLTRTIRA